MKEKSQVFLLCETRGGGTLRHVVDLHVGLSNLGWNVTSIIPPPLMYPQFETELQRIRATECLFLPMRRTPRLSDLYLILRIRRRILETSLRTILHAHSTKAGMLGAALRPWCDKALYTPHAFRSSDPTLGKVNAGMIRLAEKSFVSQYDRVIAVSPTELDYAAKMGIQPGRLRYIPNGIRSENVPELQALQSSKHSEGPCLGFVGRLDFQKNPLLFVDVLRLVALEVPGVHAIVVGDGQLKRQMVRYAESFGLAGRIDWRGSVDARAIYREMDILVHTSHYEGLPYTLLEAAANQVLIVATRNGGSVAILGEALPNAIAKSFAPEDLAAIVKSLLLNADMAARHRDKLKSIADWFSIDKMVSAVASEYSELLRED